jgi:hypothetical protein
MKEIYTPGIVSTKGLHDINMKRKNPIKEIKIDMLDSNKKDKETKDK